MGNFFLLNNSGYLLFISKKFCFLVPFPDDNNDGKRLTNVERKNSITFLLF